jgi:hypothetical protein
MVASLLAVLASGIQDDRIAFRRTLYPFHKTWVKAGRFTTRWERLDFENTPSFGQTGFVRLLRKGHLITRLFLVSTMPDIHTVQARAKAVASPAYPQFGWTNSLGHALVSQLTLDIAGSRVETIDSRLLEILDEFHTPLEKVPVMNDLIRRKDNGFTETSFQGNAVGETVITPLPFWFSRGDTGCALPIDAISADEVRVGITFRPIQGLYYTATPSNTGSGQDVGTSLWPLLGSSFYASDPSLSPLPPSLEDAYGPIKMPLVLPLGDCYVLAEYVYLDQNEANRFRLADLQVPIVQHYAMNPHDTQSLSSARIRLDIPNPCRDIFFMCQPYSAPTYNAHFLATRRMTGNINQLPHTGQTPWWPDAVGLSASQPALYLRPAFSLSDSEPLLGYELDYQGSLVRYRTEAPSLFRSVLPSYEQRKSPWVNRYYYNLPLAIQNGFTPFTRPLSEGNLDKVTQKDLVLAFRGDQGIFPRLTVYCYAETYNVLRVYGGRAALMFAY